MTTPTTPAATDQQVNVWEHVASSIAPTRTIDAFSGDTVRALIARIRADTGLMESYRNAIEAQGKQYVALRAELERARANRLNTNTSLLDVVRKYATIRNAINEPCDMIEGPCACGSFHTPADFVERALKLASDELVALRAENERLRRGGTIDAE